MITTSFKNKIQNLAGIILEITDQERVDAFAKSDDRVPFNRDMISQAIKQGREVGILFQSDNDNYKMPVAKYRIIYPVAMGMSKKGNVVIRAFHKLGQSEKEAIRTGKRSAEVENKWRLFKTSGIKAMWFTGNFFRGPLEAYNEAGDGSMVNIEVQAKFAEIRRYQDEFIANIQDEKERLQKRKNIVKLFKDQGERPLEQPYANPGQNPPGTNQNEPNKDSDEPNKMIKESYKQRLKLLAGINESFVNQDGSLENFDFNNEVEIMGPPFFPITFGMHQKENAAIVAKAVNQGIDSNLEGFTKSVFGVKHTSIGKLIVFNIHDSEMHILDRRLREMNIQPASDLADDIELAWRNDEEEW